MSGGRRGGHSSGLSSSADPFKMIFSIIDSQDARKIAKMLGEKAPRYAEKYLYPKLKQFGSDIYHDKDFQKRLKYGLAETWDDWADEAKENGWAHVDYKKGVVTFGRDAADAGKDVSLRKMGIDKNERSGRKSKERYEDRDDDRSRDSRRRNDDRDYDEDDRREERRDNRSDDRKDKRRDGRRDDYDQRDPRNNVRRRDTQQDASTQRGPRDGGNGGGRDRSKDYYRPDEFYDDRSRRNR